MSSRIILVRGSVSKNKNGVSLLSSKNKNKNGVFGFSVFDVPVGMSCLKIPLYVLLLLSSAL